MDSRKQKQLTKVDQPQVSVNETIDFKFIFKSGRSGPSSDSGGAVSVTASVGRGPAPGGPSAGFGNIFANGGPKLRTTSRSKLESVKPNSGKSGSFLAQVSEVKPAGAGPGQSRPTSVAQPKAAPTSKS